MKERYGEEEKGKGVERKKVRRGMNITEAIKERGKRRMRKKGQETENGGKKEECDGRRRKENEK